MPLSERETHRRDAAIMSHPDRNSGRVFLFSGEEEFLKREAIDKLKQSYGLKNSPACYTFSPADEDFSIEKVVALARTANLFSPYQMIVVKDIEKISPAQREILFSYIRHPAGHTNLVLMSGRRIRQKQEPESDFLNLLAKQPNIEKREFVPLSEEELRRRMACWIKERGKAVSCREIDFILAKSGKDPAHLRQVIEKACLYAKDKQRLDMAVLEQAIGKEVSLDVYRMVDAILKKDIAGALMALRDMHQFNIKAEKIIGALTKELRRLYAAKKLLKTGLSQYQIKTKLKIFYADKFFSNLKAIKLEDLETRLRKLLYIDTGVKTGKKKPFFALESWVIEAGS